MYDTKLISTPINVLARLMAATAALVTVTGAALADPVSPAGWTAGLAVGAPLPEGVYFIDTTTYLERSAKAPGAPKIDAIVNLPVLAWSTPWSILGGRLEFLGIVPELAVGVNPNTLGGVASSWRNMYNPAAFAGLAWDLGSGWSFSNFVGGFAPVNTAIGNTLNLGGNYWTFSDVAALAYNRDGWSAAANFTYSTSGKDRGSAIGALAGTSIQPDTAQIDLSITKHINKWELGLVGYGSTDLNAPALGRTLGLYGQKQKQFALGGLVGYNFGPVITQFYLTRDVTETNYTGYDTRFWTRVIVPLWNPEAPAARKIITK